MAYKLNLPSSLRLYIVFHVSCLKKKLGQYITLLATLPPLDSQGHVQLQTLVFLLMSLLFLEQRQDSRTSILITPFVDISEVKLNKVFKFLSYYYCLMLIVLSYTFSR